MVFAPEPSGFPDDIAQPIGELRVLCLPRTLRRFAPLRSRMKPPLTGKTAQ
jgi:hypothetical protein